MQKTDFIYPTICDADFNHYPKNHRQIKTMPIKNIVLADLCDANFLMIAVFLLLLYLMWIIPPQSRYISTYS